MAGPCWKPVSKSGYILLFVLGLCLMATNTYAQFDSENYKPFSRDQLEIVKKERKIFYGKWKIISGAQVLNSEDNSLNRFSLFGNVKSTLKFHKRFYFKSLLGVGLHSFQGQDQFQKEPGNNVSLLEGLLVFKPTTNSYLSMGAVNQRTFHNSFLSYSHHRAFPGFMEKVNFNPTRNSKISIKAQQVIPSSYSFSSQRTEKEVQPSLLSEFAEFNYGKKNYWNKSKLKFHLSARAGFFKYTNLPAVVAEASRTSGNLVEGIGALARFKNGFEGWTTSGRLDMPIGDKQLITLSGETIKNDKAPFDVSKAQILVAKYGIKVSDLVLSPEIQYHYIERDSMVGAYMPGSFVSTNNEGISLFMSFNFTKLGFRILSGYRSLHPLIETTSSNSNVFQQENEEIYELRLETDYASF